MGFLRDFTNGLWNENPTFRIVIGMCPTLAITNQAINGLVMGLATTFVLLASEIVVSLIKKLVPNEVRIPSYVVIIATFVTFVDYFLKAFLPDVAAALSLFIPLIVVNCIILGRAEAFASKNPVKNSIADALGMGLGFTWALVLLSVIREFLGSGSVFGFRLLGNWYPRMTIMLLPAGAFISLGLLMGVMNLISRKKSGKEVN
ncbi:MAG: electron transport complex subunit E [Halanaerobiaceae bacterium]|jgi:electron transport complex protein RnfE|nr:electron transport complex subunit E [Halanaerobiaceae bacterium]